MLKFVHFPLILTIDWVWSLDSTQSQVSPTLHSFLSQNLRPCLIKISIGAHQDSASQLLHLLTSQIESFRNIPATSFAIRRFMDQHDPNYFEESHDVHLKLSLMRHIVHVFQRRFYFSARFTWCYAHLYFIGSTRDAKNAERLMFESDVGNEDPQLIIFWDVMVTKENNWKWSNFFASQPVYGKFTGRHFFIRDGLNRGSERVALICMICGRRRQGSKFPVINYMDYLNMTSPEEIDRKWWLVYKNHNHLNIPHICRYCVIGKNGRTGSGKGSLFVEAFLHQILQEKYNITSTSELRRLLDKHGMITRNLIFPGSRNTDTFFLSHASPRYILSPYGILMAQYHLFTVLETSDEYNRWLALLLPFATPVWCVLLASFGVITCVMIGILGKGNIYCFIGKSEGGSRRGVMWRELLASKMKRKRLLLSSGDVVLSVLGVMIDQHRHRKGILQWLTGHDKRGMLLLFLFWTWLSIILNSVYKGKLFARLSTVVAEPWTPNSLASLAQTDYPIISTAYTIATMQDYPNPESSLRSDIRSLKTLAQGEEVYLKKIDKLIRFCPSVRTSVNSIAHFLKDTSCAELHEDGGMVMVNVTNKFAVVDFDLEARNLITLFKLFTKRWVSKLSPLREFPTWHPWLIQKTYFANLFMPVLASWYESGLSGYWDAIQEEEDPRKLIWRINSTQLLTLDENALKASRRHVKYLTQSAEVEKKKGVAKNANRLTINVLRPVFRIYVDMFLASLTVFVLELLATFVKSQVVCGKQINSQRILPVTFKPEYMP